MEKQTYKTVGTTPKSNRKTTNRDNTDIPNTCKRQH